MWILADIITITVFLVLNIKVVFGNDCTEKAAEYELSALTMCEASSGSSERVIIDTYDSASKGVDSCSCTATVTSAISTSKLYMSPLADNLQPGRNIKCGSSIELVKGTVTSESRCDLTGAYMDVQTGDAVSIKWKMDADSTNSKYCVHVYFNTAGSTMSVTCTAEGSTVQTQPTSEATTTTVHAVQETTTVIQSTSQQQSTVSMTSMNREENTTSQKQGNADPYTDVTGNSSVAIIVSVVGGVIAVVIIIVVSTILFIRYRRKQSGLQNHYETYNPENRDYVNMSSQYSDLNVAANQGNNSTAIYQNDPQNPTTSNRSLQNAPNNQYEDVQTAEVKHNRYINGPAQVNSVFCKKKSYNKSEDDETGYANCGNLYANVEVPSLPS